MFEMQGGEETVREEESEEDDDDDDEDDDDDAIMNKSIEKLSSPRGVRCYHQTVVWEGESVINHGTAYYERASLGGLEYNV